MKKAFLRKLQDTRAKARLQFFIIFAKIVLLFGSLQMGLPKKLMSVCCLIRKFLRPYS